MLPRRPTNLAAYPAVRDRLILGRTGTYENILFRMAGIYFNFNNTFE